MLAVHNDPDLRQQDIADQVNMSGAMVNTYIKEMKGSGYILIENKNRRDLQYRLTEKGRQLFMQQFVHCSAEIVELYRKTKFDLSKRLHQVFDGDEVVSVLLYGGSETARLVISVLEYFNNVKIVAIVDRDAGKWGNCMNSYVIQSPVITSEIQFDCIVISSFARQGEIFNEIQGIGREDIRIVQLSSL